MRIADVCVCVCVCLPSVLSVYILAMRNMLFCKVILTLKLTGADFQSSPSYTSHHCLPRLWLCHTLSVFIILPFLIVNGWDVVIDTYRQIKWCIDPPPPLPPPLLIASLNSLTCLTRVPSHLCGVKALRLTPVVQSIHARPENRKLLTYRDCLQCQFMFVCVFAFSRIFIWSLGCVQQHLIAVIKIHFVFVLLFLFFLSVWRCYFKVGYSMLLLENLTKSFYYWKIQCHYYCWRFTSQCLWSCLESSFILLLLRIEK